MKRLHAYWLGLQDGFAQPSALTSGMTWDNDDPDDDACNEAYDTGATHGQIVGGILKHQLPQPWNHS